MTGLGEQSAFSSSMCSGADVQQAVAMLQALRDPTRQDHSSALHALDSNAAAANAQFVAVMLHVFASGAQYQTSLGLTADIRQLAGLVIKNYVFPHLVRLPVELQNALKNEVIRVLSDDISDIRKTAAILAGKISESFPIATWADMLPPIFQLLDAAANATTATVAAAALDGGLQAVRRICEDSAAKLAQDDDRRPLDALVPLLLRLLQSADVSARINALACYNCLLPLLAPPPATSATAGSRNSSFDDCCSLLSGSGDSPVEAAAAATSAANAAQPLMIHMNDFIQMLSALAGDSSSEVRTGVCQAIGSIACHHVALLEPCFRQICRFMLQALQDPEESVAIEACEFWVLMLDKVDTKRAISALDCVPELISLLIDRLYLTEEQMENERIEEEEESSGEKELNLKPMHHRPQGAGSKGEGSEEADNAELSAKWTLRKQAALTLDTVALSFPPQEILTMALPKIQQCFQNDSNVLVKESGMLALGAVSSGCLEAMTPFVPQIFPFLLQHLRDPLPEMRCISCWVLSRYCRLFEEMNYSSNSSSSSNCGSSNSSRSENNNSGSGSSNGHSVAAVATVDSEEVVDDRLKAGSQFYLQSLEALLSVMFDAKPKVQVAACSALCLLVENAFTISYPTTTTATTTTATATANNNNSSNSNNAVAAVDQQQQQQLTATTAVAVRECSILSEQLPVLLQAVNRAFSFYGAKSSLILVDTIGTIADTVREDLKQPQFSLLYLPPLMDKFNRIEDGDMRLFPVLECFTSVLAVIGLEAQAHLQSIYSRCLHITATVLRLYAEAAAAIAAHNQQLQQQQQQLLYQSESSSIAAATAASEAAAAAMHDLPSKDFAICCLDVISAISEGLGQMFVTLVNETNSSRELLLQLMFQAAIDELPELRQAAYSLAGEICKNAFELLDSDTASRLLQLSVRSLDTEFPLVCNNAAWTVGELALKAGGSFLTPFIPRLMHLLVTALQTMHMQDNLKVNVAVTIGRIAAVAVEQIAEYADEFFADWCSVLALPCPSNERSQAFTGLLLLLHHNPAVLLGNKTNIYAFLTAAVSWQELPPQQLRDGVRSVLVTLRSSDEALWQRVMAIFAQEFSVQSLLELYQLQ